MNVNEFIAQYRNHPVLFIGSGLSFRYLDNTYTWDALLSKVCEDIWGNDEHYLDIKSSCNDAGVYHFDEIASKIEHEFNDILVKELKEDYLYTCQTCGFIERLGQYFVDDELLSNKRNILIDNSNDENWKLV